MEHKVGCAVCGAKLVYRKHAGKAVCSYCREEFLAEARCVRGHFVCDECHGLPAMGSISRYCKSSCSRDPLEMALVLMRNPAVKMHGPEHHFLVPAVLISSFHNAQGDLRGKAKRIDDAERRAKQVPGGFCGFLGDCGAAVGTGIFVSLVTGATPMSRKEWRLANLMTARSLFRIAKHGGPRCCKMNTRLAIEEAVAFSAEKLGVGMEKSEMIKCEFDRMNQECLKAECPFYGKAE